MKSPTRFQLEYGLAHIYDPVKAREYYLRTRQLKGRRKGSGEDPRTGKTRQQIASQAKARQRKELQERIGRLEDKLKRLDAKIREMEREDASEDRKSKAKKERSRKEREKPKTAAEKAKDAREAEKYRKKNQQKLKSDRKKASSKSGGGSKKGSDKKATVGDLKTLATKVRGQIAVAKQKLAAL